MTKLKDIPGFEGRYGVTEDGRVWSHPKKWVSGQCGKSINSHLGKWLQYNLKQDGYPQVGFLQDGKYKRFSIHRLVAMTFLDNPNNKKTINHIDGNKLNNHVSNLEWCTHKENMQHAWRNGLCVNQSISGNKTNTNPLNKPVQCIETGKIYHSGLEAQRQTGIFQGGIGKCCRNQAKIAGGYSWKFV